MQTTRSPLNFWALWTATALGNLSDGIFKLALPLFAVSLTSAPLLVAGVSFLLSLPWLLFALPVGALADRLDRRQILFCMNGIRTVVLCLLVLLPLTQWMALPLLYCAAFVLGIAETFADTAASTLTPAVVPKEELEKANARIIGAQTVANEFVGPVLGGFLATIGLVLALGSSSLLYGVAWLALLFLRGSFLPARTGRTKLSADIADGVRFVLQHRLLRTLVLIVTVMNICWSAWGAILVLYVVAPGPVGLNQFGYGVLLTGIGIGGFLGTLLVMPSLSWIGRRGTIAADIIGTIAMLLVPALTTNAWLIGIAAVIGGAGATMWSVTVRSLFQRIVPDAFLGRVGGVNRMLGFGAYSLGAALAGVVAEFISVQAVFLGGALLTSLLFMPFFMIITEANITAAEQRATLDSGHDKTALHIG